MASLRASEPLAAAQPPSSLPDVEDVFAAAERLKGHAVLTPLLESDALNARLGGRLLIKAEPLQRTGSFKFRGAYNRISRLNEAERERGVVAYSSGNHAQAVAAAAHLAGTPAVIVMPADAPAVKMDGTRRYGAEIVTYDRGRDNREAIAERIVSERGAILVKPFDDPFVIAGQGTVGLEIAAQCQERGVAPEFVVVPAGGGGLMAGCALALKSAVPTSSLYTAEPEGFDDHALSFAAGERRGASNPSTKSLCDALLSPQPGELTFAINRTRVTGGLVVDDDAVLAAMATAFRELKLVVEPGGATALAAILRGAVETKGKAIVVVASGGNVDGEVYRRALGFGADD